MTPGSLLALFGAGLLTFASPCVLPMLPIYLSTLGGAGAAENDDPEIVKRRLRRTGVGFAVGLAAVFVALGAGASVLSASLGAHRRAFTIGAGALMVLFGARLLGVLPLRWLDGESRPLLGRVANVRGFWGGALFGAAFALGWTPCVGPVLGAALSYAASTGADVASGVIQLAAYALGLAAPLVAASFAAPAAVALTRRLLPATPILQRATGALVVVAGALLATDRLGSIAPTPVAEATPAPCETGTAGACGVPGAAAPAAEPIDLVQGKPRFLEFESAHCTVCARMAPLVKELEDRCAKDAGTVVRVRVDDPAGRALAARYGVRFVPTFLNVDAEGEEVERSVGEQPKEQLARMLAEVKGEACAAL